MGTCWICKWQFNIKLVAFQKMSVESPFRASPNLLEQPCRDTTTPVFIRKEWHKSIQPAIITVRTVLVVIKICRCRPPARDLTCAKVPFWESNEASHWCNKKNARIRAHSALIAPMGCSGLTSKMALITQVTSCSRGVYEFYVTMSILPGLIWSTFMRTFLYNYIALPTVVCIVKHWGRLLLIIILTL